MSEELLTWISNKKFKIFDKIDGKSNINDSDSVVVKNAFLENKDIRVFYSKRSLIDSILTNSSVDPNNGNVLKWFNDIKHRKQVLQTINDLMNKSAKVLGFLETISSKTSIKISGNRVKNLLKTLSFSINNEIFENSNQFQFKTIVYSIVKTYSNQSFVLRIINEIIGCLVRGLPIALVAVEAESALFASYFLDLCERAGLQPGIINFLIIDSKTSLKLSETTKPMVCPIFVVLESADIECAIDRIISTSINDTFGSLNVFVQQTVSQKFTERLKSRSNNSLEIGDRFDTNVDILSKLNINYEAIDFDNQNKLYDIQVFKFRTNDEIKSLVNHFTQIPFMSLWAEKTSLALEIAKLVNSSQMVFINSSLRYPIGTTVQLFDKVMDKTELNLSLDQKSFEAIINSNKKWKSLSLEERLAMIRNFLISNETEVHLNPSVLKTFNKKVTEIRDKYGIQIVMTDFEALGLLAVKIDTEINEQLLTLLLESLISGNSLIIDSTQDIKDLEALRKALASLGYNCLNFVDLKDKTFEGNSILTFNGNSVGIYLQKFRDISADCLMKTIKTINLTIGDISFAK